MQNTDSPPRTVPERIRAAMADRKISATALARQLGFTQAYLSRRMTGDVDFRAAELTVIAEALEVPVSQFLAPESATSSSP